MRISVADTYSVELTDGFASCHSRPEIIRLTEPLHKSVPGSLAFFEGVLFAKVSGLFLLVAPEGGVKGEVQPKKKIKSSADKGTGDASSISDLMDAFNRNELVDDHPGFSTLHLCVGDLMPWDEFIEGCGRWYHAFEALCRQIKRLAPMKALMDEIKAALQRLYEANGAELGQDFDGKQSVSFNRNIPQ